MRTPILVLSSLVALAFLSLAAADDSCAGEEDELALPTGQTLHARVLACEYSYPNYEATYRDASIGVYDPATGLRVGASGSSSDWSYTYNGTTHEYDWTNVGIYVYDERGNLVPAIQAYVGDGSSNGYDYGYAYAGAYWGPFYQHVYTPLP